MKQNMSFHSALAILLMLTPVLFTLSCCKDNDENTSSGIDIRGYWVKEDHLNNPTVKEGGGGIIRSVGYQFVAEGEVKVFDLQHKGLPSRYSSYEANSSWTVLTKKNGVSFYINPNIKTRNYIRTDNTITIDPLNNPVIMTISSKTRMIASSADGWSEGVYIKVDK